VGQRLARQLVDRFDVIGTARSRTGCEAIVQSGARALELDLDRQMPHPGAIVAPWVFHLAPPSSEGSMDFRTRRLVEILQGVRRLVYVSTTGVYGDCHGEHIDETRAPDPQNARARRRLDAETVLRKIARKRGIRLAIVRVPGIYAKDRLPIARLRARLPALNASEDVYTNHIHADDLVLALKAALFAGRPMRIYNASDDSELLMGEYFDRIADTLDLPRPPRADRAEIESRLTPIQLSFMRESRRLSNSRMKLELGVRLEFPSVDAALPSFRRERSTIV
jgi:nucleoside-diphosphate-sugar epimerase